MPGTNGDGVVHNKKYPSPSPRQKVWSGISEHGDFRVLTVTLKGDSRPCGIEPLHVIRSEVTVFFAMTKFIKVLARE